MLTASTRVSVNCEIGPKLNVKLVKYRLCVQCSRSVGLICQQTNRLVWTEQHKAHTFLGFVSVRSIVKIWTDRHSTPNTDHFIMTGKISIKAEQFFPLADSNYGLRRHSLKIRKDRSNLDIRKHFFSQRVVNAWNKLPQHVVDAPSVNSFKNRLDNLWKDMDITSCAA